jgi:BlaI family transcriptional regulator, penicillinase repressor
MKSQKNLSRRERQIMDVIYSLGEATAQQVLEKLPNPPGYSAVRAMLRILEEKGHLNHKPDGPRYIFRPTLSTDEARRTAMKHMLQVFFAGSTEKAVSALLDISEEPLGEEEYRRLVELIRQAHHEGR